MIVHDFHVFCPGGWSDPPALWKFIHAFFTQWVKACYNGSVDIGFRDAKLERTFVEGKDHARLGNDVFRAFLQKVQILASADSEADLYAIKSLHFEKLSGDRKGQRSIRLNSQFRLVFTIRKTDHGSLAWIIEVVDYH